MPHYRCSRCGREFPTGSALRTHVERRPPAIERRHTGGDPRWWVAAENPAEELPFSQRPRSFRYGPVTGPEESAEAESGSRSSRPRRRASPRRARAAPVDIEERTDRFVLTADLPGTTTRDIDVTVRGPRVRLVAEYPTEPEDEDGVTPVRRERPRGRVERTFRLPDRVDESRVTAVYLDGTLRVDLPKLHPRRSVDIE